MALPHQSIATINSPQFINLQPLDINPLMSKCEIKVLYLGENQNRSYISKEVATEMAKSLRGAPIVGYYKKDKEDFADHGEQIIFDDQGIHFNCLTRPYGFVSPDSKVWFQKFNDSDEFGNQIQREYLMTTGYLWTGQFEQAQAVMNGGKPQSMELQEETLNGHWSTDVKKNIEFFIINDAIFTKLCILGDDTQPCFQGASITTPEVSKNFSKVIDNNFKMTLFSMMNDLRDALKGGNTMGEEEKVLGEETFEASEQEEEMVEPQENFEASEPIEESSSSQNFEANEENQEEPESEFTEGEQEAEPESDFEKKEDEDEEEKQDDSEDSEDSEKQDKDDDEEEEEKKKYSLLEQEYNDLQAQYNEMKIKYDQLVEFKRVIDNEKKDALIAEFYMLSDEDKMDIVKNKENYSLDEIKAKLAVICFEKKVNFNSEESEKIDNKEDQPIITYTYPEDNSNLPDWVKAVKNIENDF